MNTFAIRTSRLTFTFALAAPLAACSGSDLESLGETEQAIVADPVAFCLADTTRNPIIGTPNNNTLIGTAGDDCIVGLGGQDTISAGGGNDIVFAGDGDDTVNGGLGNDVIDGGSGQDMLTGGAGDDSLDGGDGDDRLFGSAGADRLLGGSGQDRLSGEAGADRLEGGVGDDVLTGGDDDDTLSDCTNHNRFDGGAGTDTCFGLAPASTFTSCSTVSACTAQTVVDQSFTTPLNLGASLNEGSRFVAQTYTAGISGSLSGVSIDVQSTSSFALRVTIRGVTGGLPNATVLGQTTLATGAASLTDVITFTPPIAQVSGQRYAIVVDYPDAPLPPSSQGTWQGATDNVYPNGGLMFSSDATTWVSNEALGFDLHFVTLVAPN